MTTEANKALVQRFVEDVLSGGNVDALADFIEPGSLFAGGLTHQIMAIKTAFPDSNSIIDEIVAEGDKVVVRTTMRGTNTGPLVGLPGFGRLERPVPQTGKPVMVTSIHVFTIRDGKVVSMASEIDQIGLLQQLGWRITPPDQTK
jgi:predicted ester cyclase